MSKKPLQIFVWILLPVITFFLGLSLRPSQKAGAGVTISNTRSQESGQATRGLANRKSAQSNSSPNNQSSTNPNDNALNSPNQSGTKLSSANIKRIGQSLREELNPLKRRQIFNEFLQGMTLDNEIDKNIFNLFIQDKLYLKYAKEYINPSQIDEIDANKLLI